MPEILSATGNQVPQPEFGRRSAPVEPQPPEQGDQRANAQQDLLEQRRVERAQQAQDAGRVDLYA